MCSLFIEGHICIRTLQAKGFCVALLVELGFYQHSIKKIRSGGVWWFPSSSKWKLLLFSFSVSFRAYNCNSSQQPNRGVCGWPSCIGEPWNHCPAGVGSGFVNFLQLPISLLGSIFCSIQQKAACLYIVSCNSLGVFWLTVMQFQVTEILGGILLWKKIHAASIPAAKLN